MKNLLDQLWKQFRPPRAYSWQTLVLISAFSWIMSFLAETLVVKELLARLGWFFLTLGVSWALSGTKLNFWGLVIEPGPWVTGALLSIALFGGWGQDLTGLGFILWPLLSTLAAAIPKLFPRFIFRVPDPPVRQQLVIQLLLSLVLSSWIQFHFVVQRWLREYPSLLAENFSQSAFVVRLDRSRTEPRGVLLLNLANNDLEQSLEGLPWPDTERWLINLEREIGALRQRVLQRAGSIEEDALWRFEAQVPPGEPEYTLRLRAVWLGPSNTPAGYFLEKACLIEAANSLNPATPGPSTRVSCQPNSVLTPLRPQPTTSGGEG